MPDVAFKGVGLWFTSCELKRLNPLFNYKNPTLGVARFYLFVAM